MKKRLFAILLCLVMIVGLLPAGALAVQDTNTAETHVHSSNETAAAAAGDVTYLAFTSDVHNQSDNTSATRITNWLNAVSGKLGIEKFDAMCFCGDYSSMTSEAQYWSNSKSVFDAAKNNAHVEQAYFSTGNHEAYPQNGNYKNTTNPTKEYVQRTGVANVDVNADDYIIYCFGPETWSGTDTIDTKDIQQLKADLATFAQANQKKPVFILSHFPLHAFSSYGRNTNNKDDVIKALNEYSDTLDIFFLWGHNHSSPNTKDPRYDTVYTAGAMLDSPDAIQFTYCAAGCMSDSDYGSGSARVLGKGLVAAITDTDVTLEYYDVNNNEMADTKKVVPLKASGASSLADDSVTYTLATSFEDGKNYVIANDKSGEVYVVSNDANGNDGLKAIAATA